MEKEINFNKCFKIRICSDLDYEGMVVDVVYKDVTFASLNQDKGVKNIEITIYPSQIVEYWKFSYKEFMDILEEAKKTLIQINKEKK